MTMRKRFTPPTLAASLAAVALLAGCGDGDSSSTEKEEHEAAVTPQKAIAEIAAVRTGLAAGLAAYEAGQGGESRASSSGDAYLQHFELVEVPLEQRDEELKNPRSWRS